VITARYMMTKMLPAFTLNLPVRITSLLFLVLYCADDTRAQKISFASGKFNNPAVWNPAGVPSPGDSIVILPGHHLLVDQAESVSSLTISDGALFTVTHGGKLTISGNLTINGNFRIDEGDISLTQPGTPVTVGATGHLYWSPADNSVAGHSLFINGIENLHAESTLEIVKWYSYNNAPFAKDISGHIGNLILNSNHNGLIFEWDQQNYFETHLIKGMLTVDQGWIVLDRSGNIKNTAIGKIRLANVNSYLDVHHGNHPSTIKLITGSFENNGGTFNGITNGNGNFRMEVAGDMINKGITCLIYNSGISGVSNGIAYLKTGGRFEQTSGDFRGIFNITTTQSGKAEMEFGSIDFRGGLFMTHYGCHTSNQISAIKVNGDLVIQSSSASSRFRLNGLTSLAGTANNLKLNLTILGNLLISGPAASEFISSGSTGSETVRVAGDVVIDGGYVYFNHGMHLTELLFDKNFTVNSGIVSLSKSEGSLFSTISGNMQINGGEISFKSDNGNASINILGSLSQEAGTFLFHNNPTKSTNNIVYATIFGACHLSGGSLIFDNNPSSGVAHKLSLNSTRFILSGNMRLSTSGDTNSGTIYYDYPGSLSYSLAGDSVKIQNVRQEVTSGCTLKIESPRLLVGSSSQPFIDMLTVSANGVLHSDSSSISRDQSLTFSGLTVESGGKIRTSHPKGLYNGTPHATIDASGNMDYLLHTKSIIEYFGDNIQVITGIGLGNATQEQHRYGVLEVNKPNGIARLQDDQTFVRTQLVTTAGCLDLSGYNLTLLSGKQIAIKSGLGFIRSESTDLIRTGQVIWKNLESGYHDIPFGLSANEKVPLSFYVNSGTGKTFIAATRSAGKDNRPLPNGITHLNIKGNESGTSMIIDRWYYIHAPGVNADLTLSYLPGENTVPISLATQNFSVIAWQNSKWNFIGGNGNGTLNNTGSVTINNFSTSGHLLLASNPTPLPADILEFLATPVDREVKIDWTANSNILADQFVVERSPDGINYYDLHVVPTVPHTGAPRQFTFIDRNPLQDESYYRIRQRNMDGTIRITPGQKVQFSGSTGSGIQIASIYPNPFNDRFDIQLNGLSEETIEVHLFTTNGQCIYSASHESAGGMMDIHCIIPTETLPGLYILRIRSGQQQVTQKLLKK
jgi:hypothetical protein